MPRTENKVDLISSYFEEDGNVNCAINRYEIDCSLGLVWLCVIFMVCTGRTCDCYHELKTQLYHWMEVSYKRKVFHFASKERSKPVEKLNEKAAIELGAELLGETIIFVIAVVTITLEFIRQQRKASKEAAIIEARWKETESKMCNLEENIKETSENFNRILELMKSQDQAKLKTLLPLLEDFNKRR
ncbi:uncharacterized protein LOC141856651 [Brevipalpus obovatus]|uniref:uncharacterized protein LOC141856651 n=1 Tax=Brevipalpus obovatus TaxID=246614 RepID=UPI003D9E59FE